MIHVHCNSVLFISFMGLSRANLQITALFNNIRTLKFKGRATNVFFTAVNQIFSVSSQLTTTAEHCFIVWIVHRDLITTRSPVVGSCEEPPNIWLTVAKNVFVAWAFNFRVRIQVIERRSKIITCMSSEKNHSAIIQFVLIKWGGVYSNRWIIKDYFAMSTVLRLYM